VDFYLPIRNLSCADMSLAKVVLKAGSTTGRNHHPGYEAILMVSGEVSVFSRGIHRKTLSRARMAVSAISTAPARIGLSTQDLSRLNSW